MSVPSGQLLPAPTVYLPRSVALPAYARTDLAYTNTQAVFPLVAGLSTVHTVPGGQLEQPEQITLTWITSAVVANRFIGLQFKDNAGNVIGQTYMSGPQTAGTTFNYTFMLDAGSAFVAGNFGIAPLPFMFLREQYVWHVVCVNADSGDQQDGLTHTEVVIPTGPPLAAATPTITATPVIV